MRKLLAVFIFLFSSSVAVSQKYIPLDTADYKQRKEFIQTFKDNFEKTNKELKLLFDKKTFSSLKKMRENYSEIFTEEIAKKNYSFTSGMEKFAQNIIQELQAKNPEIQGDIKILISKNNVINAYCLMDGTLVLNMGLFAALDNEDQLASIISHEIGHKVKKHSLNAQLRKIKENEKNKEVVASLKEEKYDKSLKAFDILKKQTYSKRSTDKKEEIESDSLGYIFYSKTRFKKAEYIYSLNKLKKDTLNSKILKIETYQKFFATDKQSFQENWLKNEDFSKYNYNHYKAKLDKDSLATHPEIEERITILRKNFKELQSESAVNTSNMEFEKFKKIAEMEKLANLFYQEKHGLGLYQCLLNLQEGTEVDNNLFWLQKFMAKIYEGRKQYKLNAYVEQIEPKNQTEDYIMFLNLLWNLKLEEIKNLSDYYNKAS